MTEKEVKSLLNEAYCFRLSHFPMIAIIFEKKEDSDNATKALLDFFGNHKLGVTLEYQTHSVLLTIYDTETGIAIDTYVPLCEDEDTEWFDGRIIKESRSMLVTGWNNTPKGFRISHFEGLDKSGFRNIDQLIVKRV